jgi:ATP-dependent helicase/DNAse subunit B
MKFHAVAASEAQLDDQVVIFSAPGESRECVEIVRRVFTLAQEGIAFDRMAVLLRSPQEYRSHLEEAFDCVNANGLKTIWGHAAAQVIGVIGRVGHHDLGG